MEFIKRIDWSKPSTQLIVLGILGFIAFLNFSGDRLETSLSEEFFAKNQAVSEYAYDVAPDMGYDSGVSGRGYDGVMPPIEPTYTPGNDAEDYEVKDYSVTVETRNLAEDCEAISSLMGREDIIFENKNEHDQGCGYTFKVEKDSVAEVLSILEKLDPKDINENTYTIKREITSYASEIEILEKKLATLDQTLTESLESYDRLIAQATSRGDIATMAQINESKITLIERLTLTKIDTTAQLDRLSRAKADSMDRLSYTHFYVSIYENTFVNGEQLKSSWTEAVKSLVQQVNTFAQEVSLGFIAFMFMIAKYALYGVVLLFVARLGFSFAKKVWKNG